MQFFRVQIPNDLKNNENFEKTTCTKGAKKLSANDEKAFAQITEARIMGLKVDELKIWLEYIKVAKQS